MATYYIDYDTGSDANAGTSTGEPWKHCPYMFGWSGTGYTHVAGDRFIFKGGVTWPNAAMSLRITAGGSSVSNRDYYGVDETWYTGAAWSRPVFDCEGADTGDHNDARGSAINLRASYVHIDNLKVIGVYVDAETTFYHCSIQPYNSTGYLVTNCYLGDWVLAAGSLGTHETSYGGVYPYQSTGRVENCTIKGPELTGSVTCGGACDGVTQVVNCDISWVTQGIFNAKLAYGNTVHKIGQSHKSGAHGNAQTLYGDGESYGNVFYDIPHGVCVHLVPGWNGASGIIKFYNNIIWGSVPVPLQPSESGNVVGNAAQVYMWNNIVRNTGYCISESDRSGVAPISHIEAQNNLFITDDADGIFLEPADNPSVLLANNYVYTLAEATVLGLTEADLFIAAQDIVALQAGTNLAASFTADFLGNARPATGAWTVGAYEGNPAIPPANPRRSYGKRVMASGHFGGLL